MSDLRDLYQEVILEHAKSPRNYRELPGANRSAEGHNPLCGDRLTLRVLVNAGVIQDLAFTGSGCAISKASASMMTEHVKGKTATEAEAVFGKFHQMVTGKAESAFDPATLGKLAVFEGVREFPVRVKCASLAWHTLHAALESSGGKVTTE